jgi:hypothetical protein
MSEAGKPVSKKKKKRELKPLEITCKSTKCTENLHCFLPSSTNKGKISDISGKSKDVSNVMDQLPEGRQCWQCGADLIDWVRVHKRDLADVAYTFHSLKYELIRHHYWHISIDQKAINHALRKGLAVMPEVVKRRIKSSITRAVKSGEPTFDGRQTPKAGNIIYYAQHATATCCRKCIQIWHKIPSSQDLTEEQQGYFAELIMLFIKERLPSLPNAGQKIPPIRSTSSKFEVPLAEEIII